MDSIAGLVDIADVLITFKTAYVAHLSLGIQAALRRCVSGDFFTFNKDHYLGAW